MEPRRYAPDAPVDASRVGSADATPWWGDPPDVETCERWLTAVLSRVEDVKRDLTQARDGVTAFDGPGQAVPPERFHEWRFAKVMKLDKLLRRYRWLKTWRREAARRAKAEGNHRITPDLAATRALLARYPLLEGVFAAATAYVEVDDDASWEALLSALDRAGREAAGAEGASD